MPGGADPRAGRRPPVAAHAGYLLAVLALAGLVGVLWLVPARAEAAGVEGVATSPAPEPGTTTASVRSERWVDPAGARLARVPAWADPRWVERVRAVLAEEAPFALEPLPPSLAGLRTALASLSFVESVDQLTVSPVEGLVLELSLRKPVACLPVGGEFALVDEDGVVLEGRWPLPPRLGRAYLPVLGPLDDPLFARARTGDWLVEPEHLDALDVALSLAEVVPEEERAALGRLVVDARTARQASPVEPGVRLELEGGRVALYGRAPSADEPGELAADAKWRGLVQAFDWFARDPLANDWRLVDLRWDRPELALAQVVEVAQAEPEPTSPSRAVRARDTSGPRVR